MPAPHAPWTPERIAVLCHLWDVSGESAAQIATRLGGTTRNAVIGKLGRLGKLGNANRPARKKSPSRPRLPIARPKPAERRLPLLRMPSRPRLPVAPVRIGKEPEPRIFSVLDLREGHCRYPSGDPGEPGFAFCGHPAPGPYCAYHTRLAHR
jgi:GcrA cell cycle regulator